MKSFLAALVFGLAFLIVGVVMHQALYDRFGVFVWSFQEDASTGEKRFGRTVFAVERDPGDTVAKPKWWERSKDLPETKPVPLALDKSNLPQVISLFDGKTLGDWKKTQFGGEGEVTIDEDGALVLGAGTAMTGVHWSSDVPGRSNYRLSLEAMKSEGTDEFLALTFPVQNEAATLVVGGWGGSVVGISTVDELSAAENETLKIEEFAADQWYAISVRVTDDRIRVSIDDSEMIDLPLEGRIVAVAPGDAELSQPIGIAARQAEVKYRRIEWQSLPPDEAQ